MTFVNHDFPLANELLVVDETDTPIEGVQIQIFDSTEYQAGNFTTVLGGTITDIEGKWVDPIEVPDGGSYVVLFQKYSEYGPKHVEITT
jgi:hypothetical protein